MSPARNGTGYRAPSSADFLCSGGRRKGEANETHADDLRGPTDPPLKMTVSCADEVDQHTSVNRKES